MNKVETIARRILGWKLNRWDRWYNSEEEIFIYNFNPEENLENAMKIVEKLEEFGFTYRSKEGFEVCFNDYCATGDTLPQAIINAAFLIADNSSVPEGWL